MKLCMLLVAAFVVWAAGSSGAQAAAFQNGSFENGPDPGSYSTKGLNDTSIVGWTVFGVSVDYIGTYWTASQGSRSLDLSGSITDAFGNIFGGIKQTFDTIVGQAYTVTFDLAGNPDSSFDKGVQVSVDSGSFSGSQNFTFTQDSHGPSSMGWVTFAYSFVADATSTTLAFLSLNNSFTGPALDNVSVSAVPLPAALPLFGAALGALAMIARRRRKLEAA